MIDEIFLQKIILSVLIGALIGLEREYTKKQVVVGIRTFSLVSLVGSLSVILSQIVKEPVIVYISMGYVCFFSALLFATNARRGAHIGLTTSIALIISFLLGVMVGYGFFVEAVFLTIGITIILFTRERLHNLVKHLTEQEVGDLLEFLVLLGIIYPIIPQNVVLAGISIPLMVLWELVLLISLLNFVAFISARFLKEKYEIGLLGFLGGIISSTATIGSLLSTYAHRKNMTSSIISGINITYAGSFFRNFILLAILMPSSVQYAGLPFAAAIILLLIFGYFGLRKKGAHVHITSPFNVPRAVKLGIAVFLMFIAIEFTNQISFGLLFLASFIGGIAHGGAVAVSLANTNVMPEIASVALFIACVGGIIGDFAVFGWNYKGIFGSFVKQILIVLALMAVIMGTLMLVF